MTALTVWCPLDSVLSAIAPLGLAAAAGTALVVDLDPLGPRYPSSTTLRRLVAEGPEGRHLRPRRRGVAVIANGGIAVDDARDLLGALVDGWPAVVFRSAVLRSSADVSPVVPVHALLPGCLAPLPARRAVYQRTGLLTRAPGPGVTLPRLAGRDVAAMLGGRRPPRRWVRAWRPVWEMSWT